MPDLTDLEDAIRARAVEIVEDAGQQVVDATAAAAPVADENGGTLRDSHRLGDTTVSGDVVSTEIVADTDYAEIVAGGSRAHPIRPISPTRALKFKIGGVTVFAAHVNHPGTQPNAAWWSEDVLTNRWRDALDAVTT